MDSTTVHIAKRRLRPAAPATFRLGVLVTITVTAWAGLLAAVALDVLSHAVRAVGIGVCVAFTVLVTVAWWRHHERANVSADHAEIRQKIAANKTAIMVETTNLREHFDDVARRHQEMIEHLITKLTTISKTPSYWDGYADALGSSNGEVVDFNRARVRRPQ